MRANDGGTTWGQNPVNLEHALPGLPAAGEKGCGHPVRGCGLRACVVAETTAASQGRFERQNFNTRPNPESLNQAKP